MGTEKNNLYVESDVTAIIGKNESGKSNVLDAIGKLSFLKAMNVDYLREKNRGVTDSEEISIIVYLDFYPSEIKNFNIEQSETKISFFDTITIRLEGGLSNLLKKDPSLYKLIEEIVDYKNKKEVWSINSNTLKRRNDYLNELENIFSQIMIDYKSKLTTLKNYINKDFKINEEILSKIDKVISLLDKYYGLLPHMYYRSEDKQLESSYKYEDIMNIIDNKNHILTKLFLAAKINKEEIENAFTNPKTGIRQQYRNTIDSKIKNNIEVEFKKFYNQEEIKFQTDFDSRVLHLFVISKNDNNTMEFNERSNGLRWYISLFIDILSQDLKDKSVLYLLDEPGVHLHVNAQNELLTLFSKLAERNNQIVYTTHSPYMINSKNILNVRAVEKDINGNTRIFKNAYNQELYKDSKKETLSPLIKAIGADLKFNIGPSSKCNIITEGITDYMYIKSILDYLKVEDHPNIVPSAGVSNINRIVSILIGWGCDFKILLDYDNAGYKEYKVLVNDLCCKLQNKIVFVNCKSASDITTEEITDSKFSIENLIDEKDYKKMANNYDESNSSKTITAKEFFDKVTNGQLEPDKKTISNFKKLFSMLEIEIP